MSASLLDAPVGPVAQSVAIGFRALGIATVLLAGAWAVSNCRQVPPDSQAVRLHLGRIADIARAGLVLAWPRPIDEVRLLPGPERQMVLRIEGTATAGLEDVYTKALEVGIAPDAGAYLTGDGGVVLFTASLTWQVSDPRAFVLAEPHVPPALQRAFRAAAVAIAAARPLDDFLVTGTDATGPGAATREAVRGDLTRHVNRRLADLAGAGLPLGVTVSRIDLDATLPPQAKLAFDQVLTATQMADQGISVARTDAAHATQEADRERDRLLQAAQASAAERIGEAESRTAAIAALQSRMTPSSRAGLLDVLYRERLASLLHQVGRVTAIDPRGGRVLLPGGGKP